MLLLLLDVLLVLPLGGEGRARDAQRRKKKEGLLCVWKSKGEGGWSGE